MRNLFLTAAVLLSVSTAPDVAHADYLCNAFLGQSSVNLGDHGYIGIRLNSAPDCGGNTIGYFYLCSAGAADAICPASSQWHWGAPGLFALWESVRAAQNANDRVTRYSVACGAGGGNSCIGTLTFHAN